MKVICSLLLLAPCLSALIISCCKYFLINVKLSPYEVFEFQYGRKILDAFHLQKIPADEIILSPELLK